MFHTITGLHPRTALLLIILATALLYCAGVCWQDVRYGMVLDRIDDISRRIHAMALEDNATQRAAQVHVRWTGLAVGRLRVLDWVGVE